MPKPCEHHPAPGSLGVLPPTRSSPCTHRGPDSTPSSDAYWGALGVLGGWEGGAIRAVPCPATVGWGSAFGCSQCPQCPPAGRWEGQDTSPHPFPQRSHSSRGSLDQTCVPGQFPPQTGTRRELLQVMAPRGSEPADASRGDKGLPEPPATPDPPGYHSRVPATSQSTAEAPQPWHTHDPRGRDAGLVFGRFVETEMPFVSVLRPPAPVCTLRLRATNIAFLSADQQYQCLLFF